MVFKHGLIPLEVHSWLTANLAMTVARQKGCSPEVQRMAWVYGLYHDAGVLSLQPPFEHSSVSPSEVRLLNDLLTRAGFLERAWLPLAEVTSLLRFAYMHALWQSVREHVVKARMEREFGSETVGAVIEADNLATGREKFGYQREYLIFHSFYDEFNYDSPQRALSLACFLEHAKRQAEIEALITDECSRIAQVVGIPRYDPFITRSSLGLEYHMGQEDHRLVQERYGQWMAARVGKGDTLTFPSGVKLRGHSEEPCFCVLCGRTAKFYKGIRESKQAILEKKALKDKGVKGPEARIHMGKGDVRRALGFELDTWRGMYGSEPKFRTFQDHQRGLCDECAMAVALNERTSGLIVLLPKEEEVFERYYDTICVQRLRWWMEKREEGLCHQHPKFDELGFWKTTPDFSERLEGLDEHRARYERVLDVYKRTVEALGASDRTAYAEAELSEETLRRLKEVRFDSAPIAYGCVKDAGWGNVAVNGFALSNRPGVQALRMILYDAKPRLTNTWVQNLDEVRSKVKDLRVEDIDIIVGAYDRIMGAVAT